MATKDITDLQVVKAYKTSDQMYALGTHVWPYRLLEQWAMQPFKVCYRAMERAARRGYIEYGTSLRSGWLTDKGLALLEMEDQGK